MPRQILTAAKLFDGTTLHSGLSVVTDGAQIVAIVPDADAPPGPRLALDGILAPGLVDLQVNGGGGEMLDGSADADALRRICDAHARLGATAILPTLITDTPEATARVLAAGAAATRALVPGFAGLHLEGPHLDPRRKGAHDPALIRPMTASDLAMLIAARPTLPGLMVTLAPEAATPDQIAALTRSGVTVSLGHSDCTCAQAQAAFAAGASCVTHLFNAMSPLGHREPGLVGAALDSPVWAGLIADGIHAAPTALRIAMAAKGAPGLFLVSDAMAVAGTRLTAFTLGTRRILRRDGRLTLEDGTLAGADLSLPQALRVVTDLGVPLALALQMATARPASVIGASDRLGHLAPGRQADMVLLDDRLSLRRVWRAGVALDL